MTIEMRQPSAADMPAVLATMSRWQRDDGGFQLHPGDIGWFWRFGAEATATALRNWYVDGKLAAVGLLDEPNLLRVAVDPEVSHDPALTKRMAADMTSPAAGVLPAGEAYVETPVDSAVHNVLSEHGWNIGESWTPLRRDLTAPVADSGLRVEVCGPESVSVRTGLQRAAFNGGSAFTDERWHDMAAGPAYGHARCLVAYDDETPVATVTVWSAGQGRPGLIEPLGVDSAHRGRGYGKAVTLAAAAQLREMGARTVLVATPSSNVGAVATYTSAGFEALPERYDRCRDAPQ